MSMRFHAFDPWMFRWRLSPIAGYERRTDRRASLAVTWTATWTTALAAASAAMVVPVRAQEPTPLPPVTISSPGPRTADKDNNGSGSNRKDSKGAERCVDVTIGNDTSLGCLNDQLKQKVDAVNPPVQNIPPIDAKSSDLKVGTVNIPGVQQQYGKSFGNSVVPYRPPPLIFSSPIGGRH